MQRFFGARLLSTLRIEITRNKRIAASQSPPSFAQVSDVPNMSFTVGYANASWTLRADIVSSYVCRLLSYMDAKGNTRCVAERGDAKPEDASFLGLQSGYLRRAAGR